MLRDEHVERLTRLQAAITRAALAIPRGEETPSDDLLDALRSAEGEIAEWLSRTYEARAKG